MAKDSDNLAKGFEAENTGGVLSGLLAEEDEFDRHTLWRLGSWAVACVSAVIVAIIANQSSIGMRREQIASADQARPSPQIEQVAKEAQNEARRLAAAIETLNSDRDRLYARIAVLEQGLDSVTGAISRQNSQSTSPQTAAPAASAVPANAASQSTASPNAASANAATAAASPPAPAMAPASSAAATPVTTQSAEAPTTVQKPASAPVPSPAAAATTTPTAEKPPILASSAEPSPPPALSTTVLAPPVPPPILPSTSLVASKSMMAPPDSAAAKLIEPSSSPKVITAAPLPEVVASASPADEVVEEDQASSTPRLAVQRTEFGVDVGGANSLSGLRALWRGLLKSKSNAQLAALRPIIVIRENHNGLGMQLRLVAGPIGDAAAAAKICAAMIANDRACTTAVFEGQRLAMNPDEPIPGADAKPATDANPAAEARPTQKRKRAMPKEEAAQKPEPSAISSIFGRHQ